MNSQVFEKVQELATRAEIADIQKRDKGMSLFVIQFKKEHGRRPTEQECQARIEELKRKLQ
jgi:hypothetical protein